MTLTEQLAARGLVLPPPAAVGGAYASVVVHNSIAYISGQIAKRDGNLLAVGLVGSEVSLEQAQACARVCALNILGTLAPYAGGPDLPGLDRFLRIGVFVASAAGFNDQPRVADGASELLVELLGASGEHARAAIGVSALPRRSPVEIEAVVALR